MSGRFGFIIRRLFFYMLAAWVALTLNFIVPRLMPGDPASNLFAKFQGNLKPEAMEALKETFGFTDAPLWQQYIDYLSHAVYGDFGISVSYYPTPASEIIWTGMAWTLLLLGTSVCLSFVIGTLMGAWAAWKRGTWVDNVLPPLLSFIGSFPYFWLALLGLWLFGFILDWLPVRHAYGRGVTPGFNLPFISSVALHAFMPALTLVIVSTGGWLLTMRNTMIAALGEDYIHYAQARGLSEPRVFMNYAVRNSILPSLTSFGLALGFVLSGALLTEIVFSYPGQGFLLLEAVQTQDYPLLQGLFLTITVAVLFANWLVDILVALMDPRTE